MLKIAKLQIVATELGLSPEAVLNLIEGGALEVAFRPEQMESLRYLASVGMRRLGEERPSPYGGTW